MAYLVNNTSQNRTKISRTVTTPTIAGPTTGFQPLGGYTPGYVDIYIDGQRLEEDGYTASDGINVILNTAVDTPNKVVIVTYEVVQTDNVVKKSGDTLSGTLTTHDLIPASDNTYSIGNSSVRYGDLYLSGNTIFLGGVILSANDTNLVVSNTTGGAVTLSGNVILGTGTTGDYVANVTAGAGISGSASGEGSTPTIAVVANSGISANADGVFAVAANGISVTSDGINILANSGIVSNTSGVFVKAGTGVTVNATGVHVGQAIETTSNVTFERVTSNTASIATANITTINATTVGTTTLNTVNVVATGNLTITGAQANLTNVNANNITVTANLTSNVGTFADVTVTGNLTVSGTTTYVQTADLNVGDNKIILNSDLANTSPPTENVSIIANRGSATDVDLVWNETTDKWTFTNDGSTYYNIASNTDVSTAYTNATSYADTAAATAYSNAVSVASSDASGKAATAYSNAASYADTKAAAAYSNATNYTDTKAATAYSNATAFAANASNISSGTVANARLNSANTTQAGIVQLVDSTSNTSITHAATANSVAAALDLAVANAATAYTNATSFAANASNISSGTVANARLNSANTTQAGIVQLVDSTSNASITHAATANSVKVALELAVSNATSKSDAAYSNAVSYTDTKAGDAYTNATAFAANASNISSGTVNNARLNSANTTQAGIVQLVDSTTNTSVTIAATANSVKTALELAVANAATAYTNATAFAANATNISSGTVNNARLNSANTTQSGIVQLVDETANDSVTHAATANSVKVALELAVANATSKSDTAYTNAASYADTKAGTAYSNAIAYAANATNISSGTLDTARLPATANISTAINVGANVNLSTSTINVGNSTVNTTITSSVITTSNVVATNLSGNGASVTSVDAATVGGNTASTLRTYSDTVAATAYSNATSYADTKADAAYTNAASYADAKAANAYSNATSYADTKAANAYSNSVSYTDGVATTTYNNAAGYADTKAGQAYSNAIAYSANASTITSGTLDTARLPSTISIGNSSVNSVVNSTSIATREVNFKPTTLATVGSWQEGRMYYDSEEKTVVVHGAGSSNVELALGQREWVRCRNNSGATIVKGKPVYVTGVHIPGDPTHGHHPTIALADGTDEAKSKVIGITGEDIADGSHGYVIVRGYIEGFDTSAITAGETVHLGYAAPGDLVTTAPTYPNYPFEVGTCLTSNSTVGTLYVDLLNQTFDQFRVTAAAYIEGSLTVEGDLVLLGNTTTTSIQSLSVANTFIYLSGGDTSSNTNFTGSGLNDIDWDGHLQYSNTTTFYVKIDSTGTPDTFAWSKDNFSTEEANNISITGDYQWLGGGMRVKFNATTGHTLNDTWSATLTPVNLDSGIISNYHTGENGVYSHIGYFRDATDNKFKFFKQYIPEPNTNIDTSHASFQLGDIVANTFTGTVVGSVTGSANTAAALTTSRKIELTGDVSGNVQFDGSANVQITTSIGTLNTSLVIANTLSVGNTSVNGSFVTDGANVNFANDTLFIDHTNSRVGINTAVPTAPLTVGEGGATLTTPLFQATDTQDSYIQVALQNLSNGEYASADFVITADNGTDLTNYLDMGLAGSGFNYPDFDVIGPLDGYLFNQGGRLLLGTGANKDIVFFTGNVVAGSEKAYIYANGDSKFLGKVVVNNSVTATLLVANVDASNIVSGTVNNARLNAANTTQAGIVQLVDSVTNTSIVIAATANSAKLAYDTAISANTRAASAQTEASAAYSNAVSVAATDATNKAANAYSNALSSAASLYLPLAGGTLTGNVLVSNSNLSVNGAIKYANSTGGSYAYTQYNAATASIDTIFG